MSNAKHLSNTSEWYTPPDILESARTLMGGHIAFDPASSCKANASVLADNFLTIDQDGLSESWGTKCDTVWLNPPGGRRGTRSLPSLFWDRLVAEYMSGRVKEAVFLAFSIEALQVSQNYSRPMCAFPLCIPSKRIKFIGPDGTPQGSPTHASAIVYLPPMATAQSAHRNFHEQFRKHGSIMLPTFTTIGKP